VIEVEYSLSTEKIHNLVEEIVSKREQLINAKITELIY
jgi:hypothetical protein|tara:strand:+ start:1872 stop:1985 length:114 start_codon:yes stop_codon:yes gene_type:complete